MWIPASFLLALPCGPDLSLALQSGEVRATAVLVKKRATADERAPIQTTSESLAFASPAPGDAPKTKEELHEGAWAKLTIAGKPIFLAIGLSDDADARPSVLWIDLDANGGFGEGERIDLDPEPRELPDGATAWSGSVAALEVRSGGSVFPLTLRYSLFPSRGLSAFVSFDEWREAAVKVGEAEYVVALLDADHDGACSGAEDRWFLYRAGERPERPAAPYGLSTFGESRFLDGRRFQVRPDDCASVEIVAKVAQGPDPAVLEHHRERIEKLWFERFDAERAEFVAAREVDEARPRAAKPIPWHYVGFDEAIELAKQAKKPLFVDVMAFWCVWCYRMDYYTYPDAEVARVLSEDFVPVKIIEEQASADDYALVKKKLEANGIPAMGVFDLQGNVLHPMVGWQKPEDFLADLQKGLEAFEGGGN